MKQRSAYDLIKLGRTLFPTRDSWEISELEAEGLPLCWNQDWLREQLAESGSTYRVARKWGYPWREVKRLADHFGIASPGRRPWTGKYFLLEKELSGSNS
jgi:hypothetical protein